MANTVGILFTWQETRNGQKVGEPVIRNVLDYINADYPAISEYFWASCDIDYIQAREQALYDTLSRCVNLTLTNEIIEFNPECGALEVDFMMGQIIMYGGTSYDTTKWLECDGRSLNATDYPELYAVIGTTYGGGSGGGFNLPDFRDRVPVGYGGEYGLGQQLGEKSHQLTTAEIPSHNHGVTMPIFSNQKHGDDSNTWIFPQNNDVETKQSANTGGNQPHNNMQPSLCVYVLIRYKQ